MNPIIILTKTGYLMVRISRLALFHPEINTSSPPLGRPDVTNDGLYTNRYKEDFNALSHVTHFEPKCKTVFY